MKLKIGIGLALPVDVVTSTVVVYGGKGMGKTNLGSVLVEELTKSALRWCVLDPMGVWWGLRHSADGKGRGIECVILGGAHGDIPIEPSAGAVVADLVIDEGVNTIIDFSRRANGQMWSLGEKVKFVTEYALRLFQRQGELVRGQRREPIMQVLDEAARYIPQVIPSGAIELARCVGAWEQICEEGRNIGLGVTFLTQRSARMNKSVSELADVMFAFRTVGPNSLRAVMDWLGEHVEKEIVKGLAERVRELAIGEALVVSPGWLKLQTITRVRERETFDSSATPKPGQRAHRVTGKAAKPDLSSYQAKMAATIEKTRSEDPREFRKLIGEKDRVIIDLQRKLHHFETAAPAKTIIKTKEIQVIGAADRKAMERLTETLSRVLQVKPEAPAAPVKAAPVAHVPAPRQQSAPARQAAPRGDDAAVSVRGCNGAILSVLSQYPDGCAKGKLALLAGYPYNGSFRTRLSELRSAGMIAGGNEDIMRITEAGRAAGPFPDLPEPGEQRAQYWLQKFSGQAREILRALLDHPEGMNAEQLAEATGYPWNGSFRTRLSELRTAGVIEGKNTDVMQASAELL